MHCSVTVPFKPIVHQYDLNNLVTQTLPGFTRSIAFQVPDALLLYSLTSLVPRRSEEGRKERLVHTLFAHALYILRLRVG